MRLSQREDIYLSRVSSWGIVRLIEKASCMCTNAETQMDTFVGI